MILFTAVRFFLNGTVIGLTLIYSCDVPISKAFLIGLLNGSMSATIQYKIKAFRDWLRAGTLVDSLGFEISDFKTGLESWAERAYNGTLNFVEEMGKFGLTEIGYISLARLAMHLLTIGNIPAGFLENAKDVVMVASQSTLSQGFADIGLFKDLEIQRRYGWSSSYADTFRNGTTVLISAFAAAISAMQIMAPGLGGELSLGIVSIPYGYAVISLVGLGFYLHGAYTEWSESREFSDTL